ncbi:unnamed protein product [Oikopleura dioica]|uniref:Uncharacterized protein n=1 Tax=Oikopleura dioica TaxID=34765 RepID=E4X944_OIKDI|nr:unnamed protein product [Oikopleura dioica]
MKLFVLASSGALAIQRIRNKNSNRACLSIDEEYACYTDCNTRYNGCVSQCEVDDSQCVRDCILTFGECEENCPCRTGCEEGCPSRIVFPSSTLSSAKWISTPIPATISTSTPAEVGKRALRFQTTLAPTRSSPLLEKLSLLL